MVERVLQVALVTVGDPQRLSGGYLYHQRVVERAARHGAEVRFVSVPSRVFPLAMVDGPAVLRSATSGSDVMVVDSLASNTLGPWLAAGRCRLPVVGSVHQGLGGIDTGRLRRILQRWCDRWSWSAAAGLIVASDALAAELTAGGVSRDAMCIAPPGRDVATGVSPSRPELRHGRSAAALCVGNWVARKGIMAVLDAVAAMPASAVTLHLAGDEDVDPRYRRRVLRRLSRPDLVGRVVRHGIVPPAEIGALYDAADVFVLGSTVEPYGSVYGEAMAAGLPIVGWAAGNLPHLIDDGVEGFLAPIGDVDALRDRLGALVADEHLRRRVGAAARDRAATLPTWDDTADRFFATCRTAAGWVPRGD
jgi:glycosyltransferase involved in cell wall biosynthesis